MYAALHGRCVGRVEGREARVHDHDVAHVNGLGAGIGDRVSTPGDDAQDGFLSLVGYRNRGICDQRVIFLPGFQLRLVNNNVRPVPVKHSWPGRRSASPGGLLRGSGEQPRD